MKKKQSAFRKFVRTLDRVQRSSLGTLDAMTTLADIQSRLNEAQGRLGRLPSNEQIVFDAERYEIFLESEEITLRKLAIDHGLSVLKIKQIIEDVSNW